MNISVCIIAKNEEKNIERCLKSLAAYSFEIIVADTGSVDRTKEIAALYTEHVYDFVWNDDFAAAKNFAVSKASNAYVLVLDSDEFIDFFDEKRANEEILKHPSAVGRIQRINILTRKNEVQEKKEWINRLFPKERYHYEGRIHEQVEPFGGGEYETYPLPLVIRHTGYDLAPEKREEKARRNIALLKRELATLLESGKAEEERLPYVLYQLGKGYYLAGEYRTACGYFARGLSYDLNPKLEYVIDMVETYGYALLNSGQAGEALFFENIYEEFGRSADFQFLMGLIYMNNARFSDAIEEFKRAMRGKECRTSGVNSYAAQYNIGVIHECLGEREEAKRAYELCGDYGPAQERLSQMMQAQE